MSPPYHPLLTGRYALFLIAIPCYSLLSLIINCCSLLLIVVPFIYAIQKPKRELYLGLSILLLVIGSVFVFPRSETQSGVNPFIALISSGLVAGFLWLAVRKSLEAAQLKPMHDLSGLVGQVGEARTTVSEEGSVQVAGELWSARSDYLIQVGSSIKVLRREGFVLVVENVNRPVS